jgi:hypothetical protein
MSFTDYLEQKLLEHTFRNVAYTSPTTVYVGLLSAAPTDSSGGTELSGNGYARQATAFDAYSATSKILNTSAETFTASGADWSTVTHFGVYDAVSSGNLLAYGEIVPNVTVTDGNSFVIDAGKLVIEMN